MKYAIVLLIAALALWVNMLVMRRKRIWRRIMDWLDEDDPAARDDPYEP